MNGLKPVLSHSKPLQYFTKVPEKCLVKTMEVTCCLNDPVTEPWPLTGDAFEGLGGVALLEEVFINIDLGELKALTYSQFVLDVCGSRLNPHLPVRATMSLFCHHGL